MNKIRINLKDLLLCMSNAQDLVSPNLSNHHQQVAYLAFRLAEQMKLSIERQENIFFAALVHDIGAFSTKERLEIIEKEPFTVHNHAFKGAKLLEEFKPLKHSANIIKFHHLPWNYGEGRFYMGEEVLLGSHIIHLADRTCALLPSNAGVISALPEILSKIKEQSGSVFQPELVEALFDLSKKEFVWLDLISNSPLKMIRDIDLLSILTLEIDDIVDLTYIFSHIIDFRSSFTARHSAGVAKTAQKIAELNGFSPYECKMMLIAGYLHDLGKIAISNDILEKPAKLNEEEFNEIRTHTYYTYHLLDTIEQFKTINIWASYHHEKLNGRGYPFHLSGDELPLGSRIMAVADVFTAVTENRPYRNGMSDISTKKVLNDMVINGDLDSKVVQIVTDNFEMINNIRESAQQIAAKQFNRFMLYL
ncbi:MAG: HD domain-containing protein [Bacillota bacterium]|nr:HD domain-containing protein [Bacillota bacterium]